MQLIDQMLGKRCRGILDPIEIESLFASARGHHVGKAVGLQRLGLPVAVEWPVVIGLSENDLVSARVFRRLFAIAVIDEIAWRLLAAFFRRRFEQRVL